MAQNDEALQQWKALKDTGPTIDDIVKIEEIDKATIWQEVEPQWWLEMMQVYRELLKAKYNLTIP